jgi:hypothetical protein
MAIQPIAENRRTKLRIIASQNLRFHRAELKSSGPTGSSTAVDEEPKAWNGNGLAKTTTTQISRIIDITIPAAVKPSRASFFTSHL